MVMRAVRASASRGTPYLGGFGGSGNASKRGCAVPPRFYTAVMNATVLTTPQAVADYAGFTAREFIDLWDGLAA